MKNTSQRLIGYRVKAARESKNWTQKQLSDALEFNDRQSVSDIEKGKRALKPDELVTLTEVLDRDIEFFIDPFCIAGEAQFSWRASPEIEEKNLNNFEITAGKWIGLLRWLRANEQDCANPLKHTLRLTKQSSYEDAIGCAESLVKKMNLGKIPADNLIESIETKLDIPVLFVDTIKTPKGHSVSGATCHLQDFGVILINRNEPEARCFYDLAHELFHVLTWDAMKPAHRESNSYEDRTNEKRIEQLADNFAAALLMPTDSLESLIDHSQINNIAYLVKIASTFKVSPVALAWRLFNLKWIDKKTVDSMKEEHQRSSFTPKPFSSNFVKLLYDAIEKGKLSARKAAKAMSMSLTQLKALFSEYSLSTPFDL
ncbi:MAG TPA: XRE family transcriptional regulator [Gammaproteobacteria bacterium]|nr:XRE family transcriptional regulator [Gammaproteobacteria bacterium]